MSKTSDEDARCIALMANALWIKDEGLTIGECIYHCRQILIAVREGFAEDYPITPQKTKTTTALCESVERILELRSQFEE